MPLGHSRRGPKSARCPRAAAKHCDSEKSGSTRSSKSTSRSSSQSHIRFSEDVLRSASNSSSDASSIQSSARKTSGMSFFSNESQAVVAPDMSIANGDRKETYLLADKGKFVMITRKDGDLIYMLRCVDGRRVYIEKTKQGASLILTNQKGKIIKALAGQY